MSAVKLLLSLTPLGAIYHLSRLERERRQAARNRRETAIGWKPADDGRGGWTRIEATDSPSGEIEYTRARVS
jgi:hypothetical protein